MNEYIELLYACVDAVKDLADSLATAEAKNQDLLDQKEAEIEAKNQEALDQYWATMHMRSARNSIDTD